MIKPIGNGGPAPRLHGALLRKRVAPVVVPIAAASALARGPAAPGVVTTGVARPGAEAA
jgi:hypothetical protein